MLCHSFLCLLQELLWDKKGQTIAYLVEQIMYMKNSQVFLFFGKNIRKATNIFEMSF